MDSRPWCRVLVPPRRLGDGTLLEVACIDSGIARAVHDILRATLNERSMSGWDPQIPGGITESEAEEVRQAFHYVGAVWYILDGRGDCRGQSGSDVDSFRRWMLRLVW